jgi:Tfp pilus assembly protein PilE
MKKKGFTPADLISLGIILLILGMIAIPHLKASRVRARETHTRTNMHIVQLTAEDFATLANGVYPNDLSITVEEACSACNGDLRNIAENLITPFGSDALLPDNFINPFTPSADALTDDEGVGTSGRVSYWDFNAVNANAARGYSIRAVGADVVRYMTLVLSSFR